MIDTQAAKAKIFSRINTTRCDCSCSCHLGHPPCTHCTEDHANIDGHPTCEECGEILYDAGDIEQLRHKVGCFELR